MNTAPEVQLRYLRPADSEPIAAIYRHYVAHTTISFELEAPSPRTMNQRMQDLGGQGFPWLVAEAAGTVLGYAYAGPFRARPAYRHTVEHSVYLDPEHHGQGLGSLLLKALIDDCRQRGFKQMIAVIGDAERNAASIAFHQRHGFCEAGRLARVGYKFERWLDVLLMQRALEPG